MKKNESLKEEIEEIESRPGTGLIYDLKKQYGSKAIIIKSMDLEKFDFNKINNDSVIIILDANRLNTKTKAILEKIKRLPNKVILVNQKSFKDFKGKNFDEFLKESEEVEDDEVIEDNSAVDANTVEEFINELNNYDGKFVLEFAPIEIDGKEYIIDSFEFDDSEDGKVITKISVVEHEEE